LFTEKIDFPEFMNIKTLKAYIKYLKEKKSNTQKYEAKLYYKYAYPFSSLVMVLIAIPFSFLMGNRGTFFGIGIAIGISMVFWFAFAMFSALGSAAILSPFISAFAPIFIFTAASIYLFMNIKT
jgi:lipopolysaccharide export system permease protein